MFGFKTREFFEIPDTEKAGATGEVLMAVTAHAASSAWASARQVVLGARVCCTAAPAAAHRTLVIERFDATIEVSADGSILRRGVHRSAVHGILERHLSDDPRRISHAARAELHARGSTSNRSPTMRAAALKYESSRERHYRKLKIWVPGATNTTQDRQGASIASPTACGSSTSTTSCTGTSPATSGKCRSNRRRRRCGCPAGVTGVRATAFRGAYGSTEQCDVTIERRRRAASRRPADLGMREGLTVVVGWNPGVVHRPTASRADGQRRLQQPAAGHSAAGLSRHVSPVAAARTRSGTVADYHAVRAAREHDAGGARHADRRQAGHAGHHGDHRGPRRARVLAHRGNEERAPLRPVFEQGLHVHAEEDAQRVDGAQDPRARSARRMFGEFGDR